MKKWIIALVAALGFAASQADAASFGVRLGYPIGVQYTSTDPGNAAGGFRIALNTFFFFDATLQGDYFFGSVPLGTGLPLSLYYGAGAHVGYLFYGGFRFGAQATGGLEYLLQPTISLGIDLSLGVSFYTAGALGTAGFIAPYFGGSFFANFKI
jgi:hypothetical protein